MEISLQIDKQYYVDHAYLRGIRPVNEYIFLIDVTHGGEYELAVSLKDVKHNKPNFKIMPSKSAVAKQCAKDFATKHWEFLKECVLIMEQCNFYDTAKTAVAKASQWDELVASTNLHSTGRNSHIKIFEFQLPKGKLKWVAAESMWKAAMWFACYYELAMMEDDIEEIVELPKGKWKTYFLHEADGREIPFDVVINRRRAFPQIIAGTEKGGKVKSLPRVENNPLKQAQ